MKESLLFNKMKIIICKFVVQKTFSQKSLNATCVRKTECKINTEDVAQKL